MVDADLSAQPGDPAVARDLLADQLEHVWTELLVSHWPRMRSLLTADIEYRSRRLSEGGIALALAGLHPRVRLAEDVLVIDITGRSRIRLDRRGLLLIPGVFAWPVVGVITVPPWQPALLYPARGAAELWTTAAKPSDALAGVLGRTNAGRTGQHFRAGDSAHPQQGHGFRASHRNERGGAAHDRPARTLRAIPATELGGALLRS
jgi:hypothetical protein